MLYLAQVKRLSPLKRNITLKLLAMQKSDFSWQGVEEAVVDLPTEATTLGDRDLALLELSSAHKVIKVLDAALELPQIMVALSKRALVAEQEIQAQSTEWELQRRSLEEQAFELSTRLAEVEKREENMLIQEVKVTKFIKNAKDWVKGVQQELANLRKENAALRNACGHLQRESQRLRELP